MQGERAAGTGGSWGQASPLPAGQRSLGSHTDPSQRETAELELKLCLPSPADKRQAGQGRKKPSSLRASQISATARLAPLPP